MKTGRRQNNERKNGAGVGTERGRERGWRRTNERKTGTEMRTGMERMAKTERGMRLKAGTITGAETGARTRMKRKRG